MGLIVRNISSCHSRVQSFYYVLVDTKPTELNSWYTFLLLAKLIISNHSRDFSVPAWSLVSFSSCRLISLSRKPGWRRPQRSWTTPRNSWTKSSGSWTWCRPSTTRPWVTSRRSWTTPRRAAERWQTPRRWSTGWAERRSAGPSRARSSPSKSTGAERTEANLRHSQN